MKILVRWGALFALSVAINELLSLYVPTRYVAEAWALAALWILFDGIVVATELAQAQAMLKTETHRALDLQNLYLLHADTNAQSKRNHTLLLEIRQRVVAQGHRLKHSSQLAGNSMPFTRPPTV